MEDIFEQIRDRHEKQEKALLNCKVERDKLAEENSSLRATLVVREDQLFEVKYSMDDLKAELKDKEEMLKRVENDYSQTLAVLVDVQDERDKLKGELEKEKMAQKELRDKLESYEEVLEKVEALCKARNAKMESRVGGMEDLEKGEVAFGEVNLGSAGVKRIRILKKRGRPVAIKKESDGGGSLPSLNQEQLSTPAPVKRGRGRPPKRKFPGYAPNTSFNLIAKNIGLNSFKN